MEKFNKEVNQMIEEYGYEAAYEYCKGKFNHYSYKNDDKNAGKYHKYIEIFRKLGMKEYKVKWDGGWTSTYYSMVTYKAGCFIGNGDTFGKVIEAIA